MLTAGRSHLFSGNVGKGNTLLKGRSEIEPFLNIVMMASDRLRYGIEIISESFGHLSRLDSTSISTAFHIVSKSSNDTCDYITQNYVQNNKRKIEMLCIQFCKSESFLHEPNK
jgi:hypothetical protein